MSNNTVNRPRRIVRVLSALGALLVLAGLAQPALAHDNLGGDELSMAYTILVVGMIAFAGAAVALVWAIRAGQFSNVEDPKYTMLENAPDLDDLPMIFGEDRPLVRPRQKQPQPKAAGQRLAGSAGQRRE